MKIAQVTPLFEAVPPVLYGGTERVIANLTESLVELGHDVTLFASANSRTRATLVPVREQAIRLDPSPLWSDCAAHLTMLAEVRRRAQEFDIIHFHTDMIHFPLFEDLAYKTVTTLHGRLDIVDLPPVYRRWRKYPLISVSDHQRLPLPDANWLGTVYHGMPKPPENAERKREGYLAFLGRFSPEKGPERAIALAQRCGKRLKMAAKIDPADTLYFRETIAPLLRDNSLVEYIGEIGEDRKPDFLGSADALLFPINWPEPFGLVMIEAMSCGTPVIAYACGSVPEIIEDGVTGYIVRNDAEAIEAIGKIDLLDRERIRGEFEKRFSAKTMANRYVELYSQRCAKSAKRVLHMTLPRPLPRLDNEVVGRPNSSPSG